LLGIFGDPNVSAGQPSQKKPQLSLLKTVRWLRHGPFARLEFIWLPLGRLARSIIAAMPRSTVAQQIGPYGPFQLDSRFAFSDFEAWGSGHNNGFLALVEACRGKNCVLDIGGHIGLVTLPVSSVLAPSGTVYTFEPAEANLDFLRFHVRKNDANNAEIVDSLIGDTEGLTQFFEQSGATGQNSLVVKKNAELYQKVQRRQTTLDRFCADHDIAPEVIKIDVEGAELAVLRGARETLRRSKPVIFLSVHPTELGLLGESIDALRLEIETSGYICREIDGKEDGKEVVRFRLAEYLMLPKENAVGHAAKRD
jgi:FkbM family methyltransferase